MPIKIKGVTYYKTSEAAKMAGISRSTLLRWFDTGIIKDVANRDRRGWRLFSVDDIKRLEEEASKTNLNLSIN